MPMSQANSKYFVHNFCTYTHRARNFHFVSAQLLRHDGLLGTDQNETVKKKRKKKRKEKR